MRVQEIVVEAPLTDYVPLGDFDKPGPFRGADKRLVVHPTAQLKSQRFFDKTPYDFRLFFANVPGLGKYSEYGPMSPDVIRRIFDPQQAEQIIAGHEDAITVVFVGNQGDAKVMITPWIMAHRFGHAIQAGVRGRAGWSAWTQAEKYFFDAVNTMLDEFYSKVSREPVSGFTPRLAPEYNALFNAIGTQRSSRTNQIKRPYEFLYEIFAQYIGTGQITFQPLPTDLGYGRRAWGTPTKYLRIKSQYRDQSQRQQAAEMLARDMETMFNDVLSSSVGTIFVM
jgi:hypothetical protein